jgi:hypothetical protein
MLGAEYGIEIALMLDDHARAKKGCFDAAHSFSCGQKAAVLLCGSWRFREFRRQAAF